MLSLKFMDRFYEIRSQTFGMEVSFQKVWLTSLSAKYVKIFLVGLISVWLGVTLAKLLLIFISTSNTGDTPSPEINPIRPLGAVQSAPVNIDQLIERAVFGSSASQRLETNSSGFQPLGIESSAIETKLDLELRGVVAFSEDGSGVAIIEDDEKQRLYSVGDRINIKNSGRIALAKVMQNSVVLDNGGTYELLTLFEESELDQSQPMTTFSEPLALLSESNQAETVKILSGTAGRQVAAYRDAIYADPAEFMKSIRITPVVRESSLIGYQVAPSADNNKLMNLLGLVAGDIITEVNGIVLDDPSSAVSLYQELKDSSALNLSLLRADDIISLSVDLEDV